MAATRRPLDATRWHYAHGPMDLVLGADGDAGAVAAAHEAAWRRFEPLLDELVAELPALRRGIAPGGPCPLRGAVARRMWAACAPHAADEFVTPMAAVAGAVAQELIACYRRPGITRAWVDNGGDIALHLAPGTQVAVGLVADLRPQELARKLRGALDGRFAVHAADPVRGVATSGWRGRSLSRGIADAVTVLAADAAAADAAATMVANAVDVASPAIVRRRADAVRDDSDLGALPVTVDVPLLAPALRTQALAAGLERARELQARGLLHAAVLVCQGASVVLPAPAVPHALAHRDAQPGRDAPPGRNRETTATSEAT